MILNKGKELFAQKQMLCEIAQEIKVFAIAWREPPLGNEKLGFISRNC
jgi:hypothetical protein